MQSKSKRAERRPSEETEKKKVRDRKTTDRKKNSEIGCWSDQKVKKTLGLGIVGGAGLGEGGESRRGELDVNLSDSLRFCIYVLRYIVYSCPQMWSYDHLSVNHNSTPRSPPSLYPDVRSQYQSLLYQ